jgi:hypothetical protein
MGCNLHRAENDARQERRRESRRAEQYRTDSASDYQQRQHRGAIGAELAVIARQAARIAADVARGVRDRHRLRQPERHERDQEDRFAAAPVEG